MVSTLHLQGIWLSSHLLFLLYQSIVASSGEICCKIHCTNFDLKQWGSQFSSVFSLWCKNLKPEFVQTTKPNYFGCNRQHVEKGGKSITLRKVRLVWNTCNKFHSIPFSRFKLWTHCASSGRGSNSFRLDLIEIHCDAWKWVPSPIPKHHHWPTLHDPDADNAADAWR